MEKRKMSNSPEKVYQSARYAILFLIALTAVNIIFCVVSIDRYFVSSVYLSYIAVTYFGEQYQLGLGVAIAGAILVPYVLAFFLSKKKHVWMIVALVLFVLDTLFVIFIMFVLHRIGESPWSMLLDIALHAFVIFELVMGVKYGKAATEAAEEAEEGTVMPHDEDGVYNEVICVVAVSKENGKHTLETTGVVRFYENEIVIGAVGTAQTMMVGSVYAAPTERMRFAYSEIARVYYAKKNERTIRIDLADGRYAYCVFAALANANRDQFTEQLYAHGFTVEPFAE